MSFQEEIQDQMNISCSIEPSQDKKKKSRNALVILAVGILLFYFGFRSKTKPEDD